MEEKDFNKLVSKVNEQTKEAIKTEIQSATEGVVKMDQLEETLKSAGIEENSIKELTEAVEKQGQEISKMLKGPNSVKTIDETIAEKSEEIKKLASGDARSVKLNVNQKTQVTRASVTDTTQAMRVSGIGQLPYLGTVMSGMFRHAPVSADSNGVIRYFDQQSITRNADTVAEGGTKPESAITWIERSLNLEKIADSIPVTKEAFKDVAFIQSEIDRLLNVNLALKEDEQLWDGDGTTPNLNGVYTQAPAFDDVGYAGITVADAQLYDLLAILRVEIANGKQSKYMPNAVVLNPADILRYKLAKATDGHYILPPFISEDGTIIDGMRVVESSQVTANTMALGDWRYGTIYDLEGVTIEMGWVNDQFIKNAMTILAEKREGLLIRNVDQDAFLKVTDIDAAIAAVTTV